MSSEGLMDSLLECMQSEKYLKVLREQVLAPIINGLVTDALAKRDKEISDLQEELREARSELKEVRSELNALEQYSRRSCLNISGMPEAATESTDRVVLDVAAAAGVTLAPTDIDCSHRVGRQQNGKNRTIIVKLTSRNGRDALYAARKDLRSSRSSTISAEVLKGVFISENLTKANQQVMYTARQLKRRGKLHSVWTDNCRMKIRLQANGPTKIIENMDDLRDLVGDEPELDAQVDPARSAAARGPPAPPTPAGPAPARDADGFQPVGAGGGARGGPRRGRSAMASR